MTEKIKIGGELEPKTVENILGDASTIIDRTNYDTPKRQDDINAEKVNVSDIKDAASASAVDWEDEDKPVSARTAKVIKEYVENKLPDDVLLDDVPTANSDNAVKSGGTKTAIDNVAFSTNEKVNTVGIDNEPTAGSDNLVKSGGVQNELALGTVYDVSAKNPTAGLNNDGKWESLSALLSDTNLNTLIPTSVRKGGMSIKFVQSSDNKYVQYMYKMADATAAAFTNVAKWEKMNLEGKVSHLDQDVNEIEEKVQSIKETEETAGLYLTDASGNILLKIDNLGVDSSKIAQHLLELIHSNNPMMKVIQEDGVNIVDEDGNILFYISPKIVAEEGFYIIDASGNIAIKLIDDTFDVSKIGNNLNEIINDKIEQNSPVLPNIIGDYSKTYAEIKQLKDETENAIMSLRKLKKSGNHTTRTITIPARTYDRNPFVLRIGLHYGSLIGNNTATSVNPAPWNDVYFDGDCEKDFSDIRVLDSSGNILDSRSGFGGNFEVIRDTNLSANYRIAKDSTNRIYTIKDGVLKRSSDCGVTWETVFNSLYWLLGIDSRDYLYICQHRGGKVYMVTPDNNGDYTQQNMIELFDADVMNPDGQADSYYVDHLCEDNDGYMYFGRYQAAYNPIVYRTINNDVTPDSVSGDYVKIVYRQVTEASSDPYAYLVDSRDQHVHHIDVCRNTNTIYVGLDNAHSTYGPRVIKSEDNGETWVDVVMDSTIWTKQRSRDYLPVWFSSDASFMLGGGETGILGGYSICKIESEINNGHLIEKSIKGLVDTSQGLRRLASFNDNFIIAGLCAESCLTSKAMLLLSTDKGESWNTIYSEDDFEGTFGNAAGAGPRYFLGPFVPAGETESQILIQGLHGTSNLSALRVFKSGNHYYKEIYVNVGSIPANTTKTITIESGYAMASPELNIYTRKNPVWVLPLNEGNGRIAVDSDGNSHNIVGDFEWDKMETSVRYDCFYPYHKKYSENSGIYLKAGSYIDIGNINKLNFNKNFTMIFWYKYVGDTVFNSRVDYDKEFPVINGGSNGISIGFMRAGFKVGSDTNYTRGTDATNITYPSYSPMAIVVGNESIPKIYAIKAYERSFEQNVVVAASWNFNNLSEYGIKIGTNVVNSTKANYADTFISNISFYDRALTRAEILSIFYGYDA